MDIEDKKVIASEARQSDEVVARRDAPWQSHTINCHCEERSDAATSTFYEIASLRSQ
jgi:hypothetical protein